MHVSAVPDNQRHALLFHGSRSNIEIVHWANISLGAIASSGATTTAAHLMQSCISKLPPVAGANQAYTGMYQLLG